mgnify:CR=1 FL=1
MRASTGPGAALQIPLGADEDIDRHQLLQFIRRSGFSTAETVTGLAGRGVGVLLLHPGWVRTRMGGEEAPLSAVDSVAGMRRVVDGFTARRQSGKFFNYEGRGIPW